MELPPGEHPLTMLVPQPEIDFVVACDGVSMVPRSACLRLGGTGNSPNGWSLAPDGDAERDVVDRAMALFGSMDGRPPAVAPRTVLLEAPRPATVRFAADDLESILPAERPSIGDT